jgi:hypothetical protein
MSIFNVTRKTGRIIKPVTPATIASVAKPRPRVVIVVIKPVTAETVASVRKPRVVIGPVNPADVVATSPKGMIGSRPPARRK